MNEQIGGAQAPRVLFASGIGIHKNFTEFEKLLAHQIQLREGTNDFLFCDEVLPVCLKLHEGLLSIEQVTDGSFRDHFCRFCIKRVNSGDFVAQNILRMSNFIENSLVKYYGNLINSYSTDQLNSYLTENFPDIFEHAKAGALRFLARGILDLSDNNQAAVFKHYALAAIISKISFERLLDEYHYDVVVLNHGIYVPHGIFASICKERGIRIVTWNLGYRKNSFIFSHGDTYHKELMNEKDEAWSSHELTKEQKSATEKYLLSRENGSQDWIWFHNRPVANQNEILNELDFENRNLPLVSLFTNVFWDAQIHYPENLFENMLEWVVETIRHFQNIQNVNLAIRIHPAEIRGGIPSRQPILAEIMNIIEVLPNNIHIIPPESEISSYELARMSHLAVIYGSKIGVEISTFGIPVLVAGEAWIKNKGISLDPKTRFEYFKHLEDVINIRGIEVDLNRALQYAHHFFFRRTIVVNSVASTKTDDLYFVDLNDPDRLFEYGQDLNLRIIVNGIMFGTDFYAVE